ncbi:MAG: GNAT family N-acetyltransferase [Prochloraceae cyanobacterium]
MPIEKHIKIREATIQEDYLIAEHFYKMWQDNGVSSNCIKSDWHNLTLEYIDRARQKLYYQAYLAEVEGKVVGSASCQLFAGLYPLILQENYRQYGYIWGVYVEPPYRGQGIAKKLTLETTEYLKSLGCTRAILNASPQGKPLYDRLGFLSSNQMDLDLR